jgi:hypothetical protein
MVVGFVWGLLFLFYFLPLFISLAISIWKILSIKSNSSLSTKLIYVFTALAMPLLLTVVLITFTSFSPFIVSMVLLFIVILSPVLISERYSNKYGELIESDFMDSENGKE